MFFSIILVIVVLFFVARNPYPPKSKQGKKMHGTSQITQLPSQFTIATFNIQGGKDLQKKNNLARVATLIQDNDIVGIQEIYAPTWLQKFGLGYTPIQKISALGNFNYLFGAVFYRWFRTFRGNAVLSKHGCTHWEVQPLPKSSSKKTFRNMMSVQFTDCIGPWLLINTHLSTRLLQNEQLDYILSAFEKHSRVILMGDFNLTKNHPTIHALLMQNPEYDAINQANLLQEGDERIDWILCKGFHVISGKTQEKGVSDHNYYQITLQSLVY